MHTFRSTTARLATTTVVMLGFAGAALATGAAPATAAMRPAYSKCTHAGISGTCATTTQDVWLLAPDGSKELGAPVPGGTLVEVTCYYTGSTGFPDNEMDHVSWISGDNSVSGHFFDQYVYFGGIRASQAGVPSC